ncbi:DUF6154 family protein [Pasteuria penetrans]|uniref:DUF6154 family protein n=1 Tax=Pasteuria penetrans TaxID=86005 RepID=UPI001FED26AA|nr:DUF6154 family protein [Pasteuria penetrans]
MLSFVDRIYALYREQIVDEETACAVVLCLLEEHTRAHMMELIGTMKDEEIMQMMGIYLIEMLKLKVVREDKMNDKQRGPSPVPSVVH